MAESDFWDRLTGSLPAFIQSDNFRLALIVAGVTLLYALRLIIDARGPEAGVVNILPPPPPTHTKASDAVALLSPAPMNTPTLASGYPVRPNPTRPLLPYPVGSTPSTGYPGASPGGTLDAQAFAPFISAPNASATPTPTDLAPPTQTRSPSPTPTPTIDFNQVRAELEAEGKNLVFTKFGFHTGVGGNRNGLGQWMRSLDAAGVPIFLKSVDDSGPLVEAQEIMRSSDVPHTLVYRTSGDEYDTPDYNLPPAEAAQQHWQLHMEAFPDELDKDLVWLETINEVDKNRSEWLGRFALETARLALQDGYRWAAFGWSSGEPELSDWQRPSMLSFLRLAGENPERIAVALHEYSFTNDNIADQYPFKVGRFQQLFQVADQFNIPRPTVLITEWGWEYDSVPAVSVALQDIEWAANLYAPYPEIKGAAIWYLGGGFGGIADETQVLITPLMHKNLGTYFAIPKEPEIAPINPEQYRP